MMRKYLIPILYPRRCPVCSKVLPFSTRICPSCQDSLPWIRGPVCFRCGKPVTSEEQELFYDFRQFPKSFYYGMSILLYNEETQPILVAFKYHNRRMLSEFFAEQIYLRHRLEIADLQPDLIVPVPIHKNKRRKRGYNQAGLLARDLSALTGIPSLNQLLVRSVDTIPQKQLTPQARLNNLEGVFHVNPAYLDKIKGIRTVLLIDDIYTTGATMEICSRALLSAGVGRVCICTVCTGVSRD